MTTLEITILTDGPGCDGDSCVMPPDHPPAPADQPWSAQEPEIEERQLRS